MVTTDPGAAAAPPAPIEAFTFGDPTPALESRGIFDYLECWRNGRYYEPPVKLQGLSRTTRAYPYLHSCPGPGPGTNGRPHHEHQTQHLPHMLLSREAFAHLALNYTTFGMTYVERRRAPSGNAHILAVPLAQHMRRGIEPGEFFPSARWRHRARVRP